MTLRNAFEGLATEAQQEAIATALGTLLTELQTKFEAGQQVALDAASLAALESINAAITGAVTVSGTVGLDGSSLAALESVTAAVTGTVGLSPGTTVALDAGSLAALETVNAAVTGTVGLSPGTTVGIDGGSVEVTLADTTVSLDEDSLAALENVTVGGTVALDPGSLSALESITATLSGPVALDSATLSALEAITATISGTVTIAGTVELGATTLTALEKTTPQIGGSDVSTGNPLPVAQQGTVDISNRDNRLLGWTQVLADGEPVGVDTPMPVTVDVFPPDYPSADANAKLDTLHTDLGTLNSTLTTGSQVEDVQKATPRIVTGGPVSVADGTTASDVCPATEVLGRWVTFQATGTFVATYTFQASNDNVNWKSLPLQRIDSVSTSTTSTTANAWHGPCPARYFRVRVTLYTSGSVSGVTVLSALPANAFPAFLSVITDALADQQVNDASARNLAYNGSSWDRVRSGAQSAVTGRLSVVGGTSVSQVLSAVAVTGASSSVDYGAAHSKHAMQVVLTGSPTTATVTLETSLNASQWMVAATWSTGAGQASGDIVFTADKPVRYVRANVTVLSGGTSPTVTAYITAVST